MAPFEALYEMRCRSLIAWFEVGEGKLLRTNLVQDSIKKSQVNMRKNANDSKQAKVIYE